tara:strand:- start:228 stop:419 length:192 start_codon:yes stop_codon:yes gene_type:complete
MKDTTKETFDLIKLRNNEMKDILNTMKNNSFNLNTTNRIELDYVISHLLTLNLFVDKRLQEEE